jgi:transposase
MTMERIEVIRGDRRRRFWSREAKERIVAEASAPGVVATDVARRHDLHPGQIYRWRRQLRGEACGAEGVPGFAPVQLAPISTPGIEAAGGAGDGIVEVELPSGRRLRVRETMAPARLAALAAALDGR